MQKVVRLNGVVARCVLLLLLGVGKGDCCCATCKQIPVLVVVIHNKTRISEPA